MDALHVASRDASWTFYTLQTLTGIFQAITTVAGPEAGTTIKDPSRLQNVPSEVMRFCFDKLHHKESVCSCAGGCCGVTLVCWPALQLA